MRKDDQWLNRLRALLGTAGFVWEAVGEPLLGQDPNWLVLIVSVWLLGGPIEYLIRALSEGRIQITVRKEDDE